jgi:hypothetical protein
MFDLLREKRQGLHSILEDYCDVASDDISVYARGQKPPNVFSILHLTMESMIVDYVCPSICALLISAKFDNGNGGKGSWRSNWILVSVQAMR